MDISVLTNEHSVCTVDPVNYISCGRTRTQKSPGGFVSKVAVIVRVEVNKETGNRRGCIKSS